jgi:REP element-mobilizing transposase RayT
MAQSLSKVHLHLVFSVKNRAPLLSGAVRDALHAYLATALKHLGCHAILVNSMADHVHILFEIARSVSISQVVEDIKEASSKWLKTDSTIPNDFAWQNGYGVFAVSVSKLEQVRNYVANQQEHHRVRSFQEELRGLLEKHGVEYQEQYLWD